jgi:hypothetical protein
MNWTRNLEKCGRRIMDIGYSWKVRRKETTRKAMMQVNE